MNLGMIIAGHGTYPMGMADALKCIVGNPDFFEIACFDTSLEEEKFYEVLSEKREQLSSCDHVAILCDLTGGTPYKTGIALSTQWENSSVIGGANLPMLVELALVRTMMDDPKEAIKVAIASAKDSIALFENPLLESFDEFEE